MIYKKFSYLKLYIGYELNEKNLSKSNSSNSDEDLSIEYAY